MFELLSIAPPILFATAVAVVEIYLRRTTHPNRGVVSFKEIERLRSTAWLVGASLAIGLFLTGFFVIDDYRNGGVDQSVVQERASYFYQNGRFQILDSTVNETAFGKPRSVTYHLSVHKIGVVKAHCSQASIFAEPRCDFSNEQLVSN